MSVKSLFNDDQWFLLGATPGIVGDCKAAIALVDEHCTDADASAYRQWTLNVARSVAEAAKEGSILGFGGERVSEHERKLLNELEQVLGLEGGVLMA